MSIKQQENGMRTIELEVDIPGTPEQVWQAIATGPGITSWFATTEVEERAGGAVSFHMGGGMDSTGTVTAWEPGHKFAYEERDWAPGAPPLATEFTIQARSGSLCTLRLVHSLFTSGEDWDDQLEGFELGWVPHFEVLKTYLTHFFGQPVTQFRSMSPFGSSETEAWSALVGTLGLEGARVGERRSTSAAIGIAGQVVHAGWSKHPTELVLRLEQPNPGMALLGAWDWGGKTFLMTTLFFFGEQAAAVASREQPRWEAWMQGHFSAAGPMAETGGEAS
ncbi:MAG: SRPBCC domain-containing protein [Thermoanaerobaculia bacterium]|nr:SRPBCC domain-containing protein [Thermoanaerobaculia bacterium]